MTTHKATYSLPEELYHDLNSLVEQRKRSRFVAEAIRAALEIEKKKLEDAYKSAASDREREKELDEWSVTDIEGWDE